MMAVNDQLALKSLALGEPLVQARDWLLAARLKGPNGIGWPHLTAQHMPTVWGGTLDAVIGLYRAGVDRHNPSIAEAIECVLDQQHEDGGFGSREVGYSAAEATAWVLFMLEEVGYDRRSCAKAKRALHYLESCIDEQGGVSTSPSEEPRTYPTAVSLLALAGYSDKVGLVATRLKSWRNTKTGGWGIKSGSTAVPTLSAQVVYCLVRVGQLDKTDGACREALAFITGNQDEGWLSRNYRETWYSKLQPNIPVNCDGHFASWCLRALLQCGYDVYSNIVIEAISYLVHSQSGGKWYYEALDENEHIWCISGCVWALSDARNALLPRIYEQALSQPDTRSEWRIRWSRAWSNIIGNYQAILLFFLTFWIFKSSIGAAIVFILSPAAKFVALKKDDLLVHVLGAFAWAGVVWVGTILVRAAARALKKNGR